MIDRGEITVLLSKDFAYWRCGDRCRKITLAQGMRILEAARERIESYTIKDGGTVISKLERK